MARHPARPGGPDPYSLPHSTMMTSPSPPPSTIAGGLVRGDLKAPAWPAWREGGEPRVLVARHTTAPPASFDDANDLTQKGWTPAPDQLPEKKQDRLEIILTESGVLDETPDLPSTQRPGGRRVRTKSGLITSKDKSRVTGVTVNDSKTKPREKLSSHSTEAQVMPSKPVAGAGGSAKPVAKTSRIEKPASGGTPIVDLTADPAPSKSKKRKSPHASDTDSGPHTRHKKQRAEIDPPAQNVKPDIANQLAPLELVAASEIPPSGQLLVEEPSTETHPAQTENQSRPLNVITEEPETMDMDQAFDFESPGKYLAEACQQPMGVWTTNPNAIAQASAAKLPTKGQQKRVNFNVSHGQISDVECISRGDTGSATAGPEATIPRSPSPLFVRPRTATPVHRKQGRHSLSTPRGSSEMELVTSNTTAESDTSRISETPPRLTGQRHRPASPAKMVKRRPKFLPPKKNTPVSSTETFVEGTCTQPEGFRDPNPARAEDQWREATGDESLPAILHSVITALHRTLKSKEDAIGDVAREYRQNALELLDAMESRHKSDRIESRNAHELASHGILRAFSVAETDMKGLVSCIRALEVHRVMTSVRHPEFREKLERVFRLYDAKLERSAENTTGDEVAVEEPGEAGPQQGNETMINDYCAALRSKMQQNDEQTSALLRKVHAEADRLLYGIPQEERLERPAPVEEPVKKVDDVVIQGLNFELDVFLDSIETSRSRKTAIAGSVLGVVSESRNGEDFEDLDWE